METMKEKAEENISTIDASKSNNETKHIQALENLQKELNNVNNELKKLQEQHIKMKQENAAKMQEIELKLTEKEQKISDANKTLLEKSTCLNTTEQDLKSVRQEKINLEEELETLRSEHAEEMEDLVDVVNDLENKDEELAQLKSFQEVQAAELTQVRKDFHELERNSKATLEKLEYKSKKDLQTANIKIEDLQSQIKYLNESIQVTQGTFETVSAKLSLMASLLIKLMCSISLGFQSVGAIEPIAPRLTRQLLWAT